MAEQDLPPERFASVFAEFIRRIASAARPPASPLLDRITAHLGSDPAQLPATTARFDTFEALTLQLVLDAYLCAGGRSAVLVGVGMENKRFLAAGLSELTARTSQYMTTLQEGPVEYKN